MRIPLTTLLGFLMLSVVTAAQDPSVKDFDAPKKLPDSEKEFKKSESAYIKAALWLETTAVDTNSAKRIKMNAWTLAWVTNCSYITIEINEPFLDLVDKNGHLMFVAIANYVKYCLVNNSTDNIKAFTAGIKAAINCYKLGGQVVTDDDLKKVIDADNEGKLEDWVKGAMKSK